MKAAAQMGLIAIFSSMLVFHVFALLKIIPYKMLWGGRLKTDKEMYLFETISLVITGLFLLIVLIDSQYIPVQINTTLKTMSFWAMAFVFFLNTIGNLKSKNRLEKIIFTPITALLCVLTTIVALT